MIKNPGHNPGSYNIGQESLYPVEKLMEVTSHQQKLTIGIPCEMNENETRIALTPESVNLVVDAGHTVIVAAGAGKASKYSDKDYAECGATISENGKDVFSADIILKIGPPSLEEAKKIKERSSIFSLLNLSYLSKEVVKLLMEKKVTFISLDMLQDEHDCFPVVRSISEIEGIASVVVATHLLSNATNGKGVMLGGITGVSPSEVVVLGAGTAGTVAARAAVGMGAYVKVFDYSLYQLSDIVHNLGQQVFTSNLHPSVLSKALKSADVVIGTMRFINDGQRFVLTEDLIQRMKPGSVMVDLSVDQGGCFETTRPTTIKNPTFEKHRVIHHCLPSISVLFGRSASIALSNIISAMVIDIAQTNGIVNAIRDSKGLRHGVVLFKGILTNHYVGNHFDIPSKDISLLLAAF